MKDRPFLLACLTPPVYHETHPTCFLARACREGPALISRLAILVILLPAVLAAPAPAEEKSIAERAKGHWAYQPVRRQPIPTVRDRAWVRTPIDAFLLARIEAAG